MQGKLVFAENNLLFKALIAFFCLYLSAGCTGLPGRSGDVLLKTEMYFGMNRQGGGEVATAEWQAFVDTCITREFTDGFTVVDARGQWQNGNGATEREHSRILIIIHPDTDDLERRIELVRESYKHAFRQQSVLRVTAPVRASF